MTYIMLAFVSIVLIFNICVLKYTLRVRKRVLEDEKEIERILGIKKGEL